MNPITYGSVFTGIGGIDKGLDDAGMTCKWQVEIDGDCRNVLQKHWPTVPKFNDIRDCGPNNLSTVDLICGGFPCQPYSVAGQRKGASDDRNLWPEYLRIVRQLRPRWVFAENVPGIRNTYLDQVLSDLESLDYACQAISIPAVALGADHIRQRFFIVAHTHHFRFNIQRLQDTTRTTRIHRQRHKANRSQGEISSASLDLLSSRLGPTGRTVSSTKAGGSNDQEGNGQTQSRLGRTIHGVSSRVDGRRTNNRLKMLGNAVYPPVAEFLGQLIIQTDERFQQGE